jgi:hypothetical protein
MARKADVPAGVLRSIETLFGCRADAVEIFEHSLFARVHLRAIATTRRERIYLRGSAQDFFANPSLMLHEYCHVLYQWRTGALTTWRYLRECARRGYWNNKYEIEARGFAQQQLPRFRTLLQQSTEQAFTVVEPSRDRCEDAAGDERRGGR